ncbi:MAG: DnaJ domain-containing protein, partial [Myxococcales bacterium]|nr:DnaJ domain-containing protein [Myxococcales bacterium]
LAAAFRAEFDGRVEVAASGVLRRVFFEAGRPVYADSSAPSEDLAAHLAAEGYVARTALSRARARADQLGSSPEEVLIEAGFIEPDDVYRALRDHILQRVLALFALENGEAVLIRGGPRPLDPVDIGQHPARLVLDGVRRKYGRLRLYRAFGTSSAVPHPRTNEAPPAGLVLRPDEEAVRKACDGRRSVVEIARAARVGEVDALAILYALSALDLIEAPGGRRAGLLPALDPEALARAGAPRTADQMPGFAELVQAKVADVLTADYYQVLGVEPTATEAEMRAAFETLRQRFDPHRVRRDGALWHQVAEIAAVVDDAYGVLSNARLRARYEAALR